jgi:hypothetical protein
LHALKSSELTMSTDDFFKICFWSSNPIVISFSWRSKCRLVLAALRRTFLRGYSMATSILHSQNWRKLDFS